MEESQVANDLTSEFILGHVLGPRKSILACPTSVFNRDISNTIMT